MQSAITCCYNFKVVDVVLMALAFKIISEGKIQLKYLTIIKSKKNGNWKVNYIFI